MCVLPIDIYKVLFLKFYFIYEHNDLNTYNYTINMIDLGMIM